MSKDYYAILGVQKNASPEEIKQAFRKKAHEHHPDKGGGDDLKFKEVNEAYQVLKDPQKRQQYDQFGSAFNQAGGGAGGFDWSDFARSQQGAGGFGFEDVGDLGDIFGQMFGFGGGQSRTRRSRRGQDINIQLTIDFMTAMTGAEQTLTLEKKIICRNCGGDGAQPGSKIVSCATCGGRGQIERVAQTILGAIRTASICPDCQGAGRRAEKICSDCRGAGVKNGRQEIKIKIPAGIDNGQTIKISGQGQAGSNGQSAGDLLVTFRLRPSLQFARRGDDIITKEKISFRQAALGDKIEVQTVNGLYKLKIPAGTQNGKVFKISGQGAPRLGRPSRGDHLVEIIVMTPIKLSRAQKKALEELD